MVLNMVSVLMFKGMGIGDAQIALWTSLIMMPWTLKFLWSPFLEMFKTKKFFRGTDADGYRSRFCSGGFGVAVTVLFWRYALRCWQ